MEDNYFKFLIDTVGVSLPEISLKLLREKVNVPSCNGSESSYEKDYHPIESR